MRGFRVQAKSLLPRRAALKEGSELTVYTTLLQIIFLERNEAGE